jgi:hypothetical protein
LGSRPNTATAVRRRGGRSDGRGDISTNGRTTSCTARSRISVRRKYRWPPPPAVRTLRPCRRAVRGTRKEECDVEQDLGFWLCTRPGSGAGFCFSGSRWRRGRKRKCCQRRNRHEHRAIVREWGCRFVSQSWQSTDDSDERHRLYDGKSRLQRNGNLGYRRRRRLAEYRHEHSPLHPEPPGSNTSASNNNGAAAGTSTGPASASK